MKKPSVVILVVLFLCACSDEFLIKNINEFQSAPLNNASILSDLENRSAQENKSRVVFLGLNSDNNPNAIVGGYNKEMSSVLIDNIGDKVSFITDSPNSKELISAIKEAKEIELGSVDAYAIIGKISELTPTSDYKVSRGKQTDAVIPLGYCENTTRLQGIIDIYKIPSLKKISTINYSDTQTGQSQPQENILGGKSSFTSLSSENKSSPTRSVSDDKCVYPVDLLGKHVSQAGINGMLADMNLTKLANIVSPSGYILEKKTDGKRFIFNTTLGKNQAIEPNMEVAILQIANPSDLENYEANLQKFTIGVGIVSDKIQNNRAWIIVRDKNVSDKIQKGDIVKIRYRTRALGPKMELY